MRQLLRLASQARARGVLLLGGWLLLVCGPECGGVDYPLRWRWSNPKPHGGNVVDMTVSPALGLAIQVAELGQIFSSSDLDFWIPRDSGRQRLPGARRHPDCGGGVRL